MFDESIRLTVTNDGVGFDPSAVQGGLGLVSIWERLNLVGGQMTMTQRPVTGTRIQVIVPFEEENRDSKSSPSSPLWTGHHDGCHGRG